MSAAVELFSYADNQVRVVSDAEGQPWFVLADLCRVLGIANVGNVTARLSESGAGIRQADVSSSGQARAMTIVDESGMYEVVIRSDKPDAVAFRRWITAEVLPTIRKTHGAYIAPGSQAELDLTNPDVALDKLIEVAKIAKEERAKRLDAERALQEAESYNRQLEPAAAVTAFLADAEGADFCFADAAKILCRHPQVRIGQRRLFAKLNDWHWIYRSDGHWCPYQSQVAAGRLVERIGEPFEHPTHGWVMPNPQVRITLKGLQDILHRLTGDRAVPAEVV